MTLDAASARLEARVNAPPPACVGSGTMDAVTDSKQSTRRKSLFSQKGDEAKAQAQRQLLHETLIAESWNLTRTAHALELPGPSHVLRAIAALGLREEYEKARGWVKTPI